MGCDIHWYVEYQPKDRLHNHWTPLGNKWLIWRDYDLFSWLAGVRNDGSIVPPYPPRGIPTDMGWSAKDDYTLVISDEPDGYERSCTTKEAETYLKYSSTRVSEYRITHPDWHTPSWLTTQELRNVLEQYKESKQNDDVWASLVAMEYLESKGNVVRVVFWFDN